MFCSHCDQGPKYLGKPRSISERGVGLALLPGLRALVHVYLCMPPPPPRCGHSTAPCSVGFSVPPEPQFPAAPRVPLQHITPV